VSLEPYRDSTLPERFLRWLATLRAQFNPPVFIAPTLLNSWVAYDAGAHGLPGYYKDPFGRVHLRGMVKNGTIGQAIFNLPVGFRPSGHLPFAAVSNEAFSRVDARFNGDVICFVGNNAWVSLNGISFAAV
jgi:hypothetical protein